MAKTLVQHAVFSAKPERLYECYMNAKLHSAFTGGPVRIEKKVGSAFNAFGGMLTGKILHLEPGRLIVQTWRSKKFRKSDPDSILILRFSKVKQGGRIDMDHVGVSDVDYRDVQKGWPYYYWRPLARFVKA